MAQIELAFKSLQDPNVSDDDIEKLLKTIYKHGKPADYSRAIGVIRNRSNNKSKQPVKATETKKEEVDDDDFEDNDELIHMSPPAMDTKVKKKAVTTKNGATTKKVKKHVDKKQCSICNAFLKYPNRKLHRESKRHQNALTIYKNLEREKLKNELRQEILAETK